MKFEDFRIGWRLLLRQPAYSAIAVLSLSISFAACFLILMLVRYSFSFDTGIPDVANVFVVQSRAGFDDAGWTANSPMLAAGALENSALALTSARVLNLDGTKMRVGDTTQAIATLSVDPAFGKVFGIVPLRGDLAAALGRTDGLALTRQSATRLFGDTEALGKTVLISGKQFQVGAIIPDPEDNTTLQYAALTGINSAAWVATEHDAIVDNWSDLSARMYVRLGAGVQPASVAKLMADAVEKSSIRSRLSAEETAELGSSPVLEIRIRPLTESYLSGLRERGGIPTKRSKIEFIIIFSVAAALVLLLATTNYINLTTVRTISRQREIAMRKVLGAGRMSIVSQMVAESMLVVLVSAIGGLLLAWLLMPGFSHLSLPFTGEHADLSIYSKHAIALSLEGRQFIFLIDSDCRDPLLYQKVVRKIGAVDALFIGMECHGAPLNWLYEPILGKPVNRRNNESRRLSGADNDRAWRILGEIKAPEVFVYAMGQEPWMKYVMGLQYEPDSVQLTESNKFLAQCQQAGIPAERLYLSREAIYEARGTGTARKHETTEA